VSHKKASRRKHCAREYKKFKYEEQRRLREQKGRLSDKGSLTDHAPGSVIVFDNSPGEN